MSYKLCKGINVDGAHNFNSSSSSAQTAELTNEKKILNNLSTSKQFYTRIKYK